jgi:iron-sulfur cluster repair protein YtfE (RIC family)
MTPECCNAFALRFTSSRTGEAMVKPHEDPSLNELLNRIVRLECKVSRLQADVSPIKAKIADLREGFKYQVDSTKDHIIEINDILWPLVHKVFPGFTRTRKQIEAIMNQSPSSGTKTD